MLIELGALQREIPAIKGMELSELCECLAMLGFPVDAIDSQSDATVLDVDVPANRGDALSHRGLARDIAARLNVPLSPISTVPNKEVEALFPVRLEADACPIYATALLKLDYSKVGRTPEDIKAFLAAMGSTPKCLAPVDASNELLHRYGHPTHAFDADKLNGGICVRWAREGETLLALDGIQRSLCDKDMVIADDSGPIALAGVIGGESTKVTENTKRVLLESAYFAPRTVRATAHRHGVHTDASHRFGRGADIAFAQTARDILANRLVSWSGAELIGSWTVDQRGGLKSMTCNICDFPPHLYCPECEAMGIKNTKFTKSVSRQLLDRIFGESVPLDEARAILESLGCLVESSASDEYLVVHPPSWRHDLRIAEDYAEEVLRIRGYDRIGAALPPLEGSPEPLPDSYLQRQVLSRRLTQLGFYQTVTLGFVSPEADAEFAKSSIEGRTLCNPLGLEYSVMRGSLLPSLWDVATANQRHGARDIRLFEIAPVYESSKDGPRETGVLGLIWAGAIGGEDPLTPSRPVMVADLIAIARDLGYKGEVDITDFEQNAFGLEIPLTELDGMSESVIPTFKPFSRYPVVTRDLSLLLPLGLSYGELECSIKNALQTMPLQDARCVDVFKDNKLTNEGRQAWLIRLRFQSAERTLTGEEVESWVNIAFDAAKLHGGVLRG